MDIFMVANCLRSQSQSWQTPWTHDIIPLKDQGRDKQKWQAGGLGPVVMTDVMGCGMLVDLSFGRFVVLNSGHPHINIVRTMWVTKNEESRNGNVSLTGGPLWQCAGPWKPCQRLKRKVQVQSWKRRFENAPQLIPRARPLHFTKSRFQQRVRAHLFLTLHNEF